MNGPASWILVLLLLTAVVAQEEHETRVFQLNARPAEATVEAVRPLLSPDGRVWPDTRLQKLIVRDTPEVLRRVETLLKEIDQHLPQVRIHVGMSGIAESRGSLAVVGAEGRDQRLRATGTAASTSSRSHLNSDQNLVVLSGERGFIHFARDVADVDPYTRFAVAAGLLPVGFSVRTVGTGFAVEPVVVEDVVRLRLTPWFSFTGPTGRSDIFFHEEDTVLAVRSGETVTVSSAEYQDELRERAFGLIFGSAVRTGQGRATITLRPEILDY